MLEKLTSVLLFSFFIPALMSFSLYAAVGILAIYFFQCTFFVACMAIDQVCPGLGNDQPAGHMWPAKHLNVAHEHLFRLIRP
jgi:hypothetical protein